MVWHKDNHFKVLAVLNFTVRLAREKRGKRIGGGGDDSGGQKKKNVERIDVKLIGLTWNGKQYEISYKSNAVVLEYEWFHHWEVSWKHHVSNWALLNSKWASKKQT